VTVDVQIGGVSCLSAPIAFASTDAATVIKTGAIDLAHDDLAAANLVTVIVNQTADGGGANTAADLAVDIEWRNV
jgi:hypothetical protein